MYVFNFFFFITLYLVMTDTCFLLNLVYKKHYPPALSDEVWRLEKIGKDGAFHKKLTAEGIVNVEDFLRKLVKDSAKLRAVSSCKRQSNLIYAHE